MPYKVFNWRLTDNLSILISLGLALGWQGISLANGSLDGRASAGHKIAELVARTDNKCSEATR